MIGFAGVLSGERCLERTCDQEPGAAQRSIIRVGVGLFDVVFDAVADEDEDMSVEEGESEGKEADILLRS